jgi:hypothetical protein
VRAACGREGWRRREAMWGEGLRVGNFYLFLLNVRVRNKIEERERGGCREIYIYIYILGEDVEKIGVYMCWK